MSHHPEETFVTGLLPLVLEYLKARYQSSLGQELAQLESLTGQINRQLERALELRELSKTLAEEGNDSHDSHDHDNDDGNRDTARPYQISFSDLSAEFQDFVAMDLGYSGVPALEESLGSQAKEVAVTYLPISPEWGSDKEF